MRFKNLGVSLSLVSLFTLGACFSCEQREEDRPFRSGTIEHYEDGTLKKARMVEAAEVAGYPVKKGGWVHYYPSGKVDGLRLGEQTEISGRSIPADSMVWFDEQGSMKTVWLSEDRTYDEVPCNGGIGKMATGFYPDGTLRYTFLSKDATIQGLPCISSLFNGVRFHPNGQLSSAKVWRNCEYKGTAIADATTVKLNEKGDLVN